MYWTDSIINSLLEVVKEVNKNRPLYQEIRHANEYFLEYVQGRKQFEEILERLIDLRHEDKITEKNYQKIVLKLVDMYKEKFLLISELKRMINKV